ncbi:hypothetical protein ARTHRO9AX_90043 [Arthrobacter sp. 9AX]|nr:hypothetical protein ARTHRO9AX_90043 [Arthrobacter sp. 9AX]
MPLPWGKQSCGDACAIPGTARSTGPVQSPRTPLRPECGPRYPSFLLIETCRVTSAANPGQETASVTALTLLAAVPRGPYLARPASLNGRDAATNGTRGYAGHHAGLSPPDCRGRGRYRHGDRRRRGRRAQGAPLVP